MLNRISRPADYTQALRDSMMRETLRTSYKRCLVHNKCDTGAPVIKGHLIPVNYMRRLPGENTMAVFTKHRVGRRPRTVPMEEGINYATTGYFTCQPHDEMFQEVDQLSDITDFPEKRILDLMCYRNVLFNRWWMQLWAQASSRIKDQHRAESQYAIAEQLRTDDQQMLKSQLTLEQSLGLCEGNPQPYSHLVLTADGKPMLAAAVFGVLQVPTGRISNQRTAKLGQWGLTLIPGYYSNTLVIHFPSETGLEVIDMVLPGLAGRSRVTGREVTQAIFSSCYDVIFSQSSWRMMTDNEQHEIVAAMTSRGSVVNWTVDAFKGSDWTVV